MTVTLSFATRHVNDIRTGQATPRHSKRDHSILSWSLEINNLRLKEHKIITAPNIAILQSRVSALLDAWDKKTDALNLKTALFQGKETAERATIDAQNAITYMTSLLPAALHRDHRLRWHEILSPIAYARPKSFPESAPSSQASARPGYDPPIITFLDLLLGRKARKIALAEAEHDERLERWERDEAARLATHREALGAWDARKDAFWTEHDEVQSAHDEAERSRIGQLLAIREQLPSHEPSAVAEWAMMVLDQSDYDHLFQRNYYVEYEPDTKFLKLEYDIIAPDAMPVTKAVKFVRSTGELQNVEISERDRKANYDTAVYQICLRTIHELFSADEFGCLDRILFNGIVDHVDQATGRDVRACIVSVLVSREAFAAVDLKRVDPKACFKSLKGVSAASLAALAPIPPVIELKRSDKRFVDAHGVADNIDGSTNLASMHWEEFENLIRELFEREFEARGGEVKLTQASRDGGVDAVAFDPDPITGGKIVIQAKRYTRTVGVSAVRDLYGTVHNEGASRGILITTADFGPDAYQFASGKPLTLMNGANLLHLLQRHGYSARINLQEARNVDLAP